MEATEVKVKVSSRCKWSRAAGLGLGWLGPENKQFAM